MGGVWDKELPLEGHSQTEVGYKSWSWAQPVSLCLSVSLLGLSNELSIATCHSHQMRLPDSGLECLNPETTVSFFLYNITSLRYFIVATTSEYSVLSPNRNQIMRKQQTNPPVEREPTTE